MNVTTETVFCAEMLIWALFHGSTSRCFTWGLSGASVRGRGVHPRGVTITTACAGRRAEERRVQSKQN